MFSTVEDFAVALQAKLCKLCEGSPSYSGIKIETQTGPRYTRLVRRVIYKDGQVEEHGSAYGFVEQTTGNILKADGWKRPAKHARGNIHSDKALDCCGEFSVAFLR